MAVSLKYSELDRLQKELIAHADRERRSDKELLKHATLGARGLRDPVVTQLVAKIASRLYHQPTNELVKQLCRGALVAVLEGRRQARDLLPFALQLVHRASHASPSPASLRLPETTAAKAREYLEKYTENPDRIDTLTSAVRDFVHANDAMAGGLLFARFIADLEFLREVIRDDSRHDADRRTAAGALTYFVEAHDAIDDALGVVGVLDDAYIAQLASERIDPARRVKTALVDGILAQWPFLAGLRLDFERDQWSRSEWSPSEFMLLNLAVGFGPEATQSNAIVLPTVGEMPLWLGVLAAMGAMYDGVNENTAPYRPTAGEFVAVAGHDGQVAEVVGYFHPPDGQPGDVAPSESARLVALRYRPRAKKSGAAAVKHLVPVKVLDSCVPASTRGSRRTTLPGSRSDVPVGPLEHLFGLDHPVRLEALGRRVIVVGSLGAAKAFLSRTKLMGRSLTELVPCGRTLPEDNYAIDWWSVPRPSDGPVLTVARDLPEAAAILARRSSTSDVSVLMTVEREEWDAAASKQLGDARVLALLPQSSGEAQSVLASNGHRFLDWTPELERSVSHRPRAPTTNPIDAYEHAARRQLHAEVRIHEVDLESVESGLATLKNLSRAVREEYGDEVPAPLANWSVKSQRLFFDLGGAPTLIEGQLAAQMLAAVEELRHELGAAGRMWSERCAASARAQLAELDRLLLDLKRVNPKALAIAELLVRPSLLVRASAARWQQLHTRHPKAVRWSDGGERGEKPVLVFEWPGAKRIARMLLPPIGDPTHVVFYRWERDGLRRVQTTRERQVDEHWAAKSRPSAWHLDDVPKSEAPPETVDTAATVDGLEDWVVGLRRQGVVSAAASRGEGDPLVQAVPVYFTGSQYALFAADADMLVATNVNAVSRRGDPRLLEKPASELRPGDVVVVVAGSERDAIRERADARLPAGARDLARTWHGALRRLRDRSQSDRAVCRVLRAAGCTKTDFTISWWLRSATQIGPHDDVDVDIIAKATGDSVLCSKLDACKKAIRLVRGEHLRASHELATRALDELEARLSRGEAIDVKIDLGDRVELLAVEAVDSEIVTVPRSATNFVQDLP